MGSNVRFSFDDEPIMGFNNNEDIIIGGIQPKPTNKDKDYEKNSQEILNIEEVEGEFKYSQVYYASMGQIHLRGGECLFEHDLRKLAKKMKCKLLTWNGDNYEIYFVFKRGR